MCHCACLLKYLNDEILMYNINSTRSIQYISEDIKKRIGKEIDKSKIMTMSCSCSNFNNVKGKLTCVAWNCSRKTTLTFVFSSFHFEILDITGKLIDHRLHISEFLLIILLPFILNQPTNKWNDNNTLKSKEYLQKMKIPVCWMTNTNILATIFLFSCKLMNLL